MVKSRLLLALALFAVSGNMVVATTAQPSKPATKASKAKDSKAKDSKAKDSKTKKSKDDKGFWDVGTKSRKYALLSIMLGSLGYKFVRASSRTKAAAIAALTSQEGDRTIAESEWAEAENLIKSMFSQKNISQVTADFKNGFLFSGEVLDVVSSYGTLVPAVLLVRDYIKVNGGDKGDKKKDK